MTVCQSLATADGPCARTLRRPRRYGEIVAGFLTEAGLLGAETRLVEVGGGMGTLMSALLDAVPVRDVTLVDLSPFFLEQQRKELAGQPRVHYVCSDARDFFRSLDRPVDLVISNENIGDLPTLTGLPRDEVASLAGNAAREGRDAPAGWAARVAERYGLDLSDAPEFFAFNLGAVEYLEALAPKARAVFLSEHSCRAALPPPWKEFLRPTPSDGYPRRVCLRGHDEYTVHFDHLVQVARRLGYDVRRFSLVELLELRSDPEIRAAVRAPNTLSETAEIVHEFCCHVADYEGLLLTR